MLSASCAEMRPMLTTRCALRALLSTGSMGDRLWQAAASVRVGSERRILLSLESMPIYGGPPGAGMAAPLLRVPSVQHHVL